MLTYTSFGTIRNNIALKQYDLEEDLSPGFGTIRNNIALKPIFSQKPLDYCFGTIRNNIALKHRGILLGIL